MGKIRSARTFPVRPSSRGRAMTGRDPVTAEWRWVDIGGEQHKVRQDDLVAALRRARLPPHVLVWRSGWGEWLPAANVGELRHAFTAEQSGPAASVRVD